MNKLGVYVHIPFCLAKCRYCDFYSLPGRSKEEKEAYVSALLRQLHTLSSVCADVTVDTVYIGGGTPSAVSAELICRVLDGLSRSFQIEAGAEITMEANPATVSPSSLKLICASGVNRLSFGIQSANDRTLKLLGRLHTFEEARRSVYLAADAGFENLSADLMSALPGQNCRDLLFSIEETAKLPLRHISLYSLILEEGTPLYDDRLLVFPGEEEDRKMYLDGVSLLKTLGFEQYEISNFAVPGYESRHNLRYWSRQDYIGLGPGAHSFLHGVRFAAPRDLSLYLACGDFSLSSDFYTGKEKICGRDAYEEEVMLSLRTVRGVSLKLLSDHANSGRAVEKYISGLCSHGLALIRDDRLSLTPEGMFVSNSVITDLLLL